MKLFLKYFAGFAALIAIAIFAMAVKGDAAKTETKTILDGASNCYRYEFSGSITNTESDTINIPAQFLDAWVPVLFFETVQSSGTQNLSFTFQESSKLTGTSATLWQAVGSAVTTSGSADKDVFRYASATTPVMSGVRARVIITGTGTQVCTYTGRFVAKRE
jgi:hypothetical protein